MNTQLIIEAPIKTPITTWKWTLYINNQEVGTLRANKEFIINVPSQLSEIYFEAFKGQNTRISNRLKIDLTNSSIVILQALIFMKDSHSIKQQYDGQLANLNIKSFLDKNGISDIDKKVTISITSKQLKNNEEVLIETPQGNIAYRLNSKMELNRTYRFKGKGYTNENNYQGDVYVRFVLSDYVMNNETSASSYRSVLETDKADMTNMVDDDFSSTDLTGVIKSFDYSVNVGTIVSNGKTYKIIFSKNAFKGFPNNMPKINDKVVFTSQAINGHLYASDIRYYNMNTSFVKSDDVENTEPPQNKKLLLKLEAPIMYNNTFFDELIICNNNTYLFMGSKILKIDVRNKEYENITNYEKSNIETIHIQYNSLIYVLVTTITTCMNIWEHKLPYNEMDMCSSLTKQMNLHLGNYGVRTELTVNGWNFFNNQKAISIEEVIRKIPVNAPLQECTSNNTLNMKNVVWKRKRIVPQKDYNEAGYSVIPSNTTYFYECAYVCPNCNRIMNKILLNPSNINVEGKFKEIDKAFSCKYCNEFFAPLISCTLDCGELYYLKVDKKGYETIIQHMDSCGRQ